MTTNLYVPLVNAHVELVSYNVIWLPAFPVDYFVCVFSVNPGKPQLLFIHLVLDFTTPCNYLFHKRHIIPIVKFNSGTSMGVVVATEVVGTVSGTGPVSGTVLKSTAIEALRS